jgi:hypothetical protein
MWQASRKRIGRPGGILPEFRSKIRLITEHLIDLALPFQKRYLYDWRFRGSYSLKVVLPVLAPDLSYDVMEIHDGGMAMQDTRKMKTSEDPLKYRRCAKPFSNTACSTPGDGQDSKEA